MGDREDEPTNEKNTDWVEEECVNIIQKLTRRLALLPQHDTLLVNNVQFGKGSQEFSIPPDPWPQPILLPRHESAVEKILDNNELAPQSLEDHDSDDEACLDALVDLPLSALEDRD